MKHFEEIECGSRPLRRKDLKTSDLANSKTLEIKGNKVEVRETKQKELPTTWEYRAKYFKVEIPTRVLGDIEKT